MHEGGISSIQFKPNDDRQVLTSSVDSSLKIVDLRAGKSIHTFSHSDLTAGQLWSGSTFSPDGRYIASGSSSDVLVWDTLDHSLKTRLSNGHSSGIVSIDWCLCGSSEQQIASLDRKGRMVLWG
jgi:WD40 repeat protein